MRIAIDLSPIIYGTGVSHYRLNLVSNLLNIDSKDEYVLFGGSLRRLKELKTKINKLAEGHNAVTKTFPIPPRFANIIWNKLHVLPIERLIGNFDLLHTSDWAEPPSRFTKVTTIHDLVPLVLPKFTPRIIVDTHKERLNWVAKESKLIIVPSIATKNDLIELGFEKERIRVVYEAPNFNKATSTEVERVMKKYGIREDYILSIGVNPRKNINRSIEAFNLAKSGRNIKYIVAGEKRSSDHDYQRGVRFLGHVDGMDMAGLITGAKALLYASLYEGFGIPIIDAFNCEVPVITSNISSMPEAAGGAAVLVDPFKVNSIASGIEDALTKPKTLIAKGLKQAEKYSWKKNAEETLKVYKEAIEK